LVYATHAEIINDEVEVTLPSISSGSYLVRITTSNGEMTSGQVVIVK